MIGVKVSIPAVKNDWSKEVENFYLKARDFQLSEINHSKWDFTEPYYVYSHDQVPIALFPSHVKNHRKQGGSTSV